MNDSMDSMKKYNVIFGGTGRNISGDIEGVLKRIDDCGKKFNSYQLIIYENDSNDGTRDILLKNKKNNYHYIFEDNVSEERRTMRLEHGRNLVLKKARELNKDNYYQYLIILDLDYMNNNDNFVNTIDTCFKKEDWDVLTANQEEYYDFWALRNDFMDYDCIQTDTDEKPGCGGSKLRGKYILEKDKFIEVDSAFGGIAIYKFSSIPESCKYVGQHPDGKEKCEHVEFNECIKNNGGKIFINTSFMTGEWFI